MESMTLNLAQRSVNVIDLGTTRKRVYIFLLVVNSNLDPILHHFRDTAGRLKLQDRKMQHWKMTDKNYRGWKMTDIVLNDSWRPCACIMAHVRLRVIRQKIPSY